MIRTASTKVRRCKPLKSIWTTAASWFSNTPDRQEAHLQLPTKKTAAKRNLGKAVLKATLAANECDRYN
jgi:hypothetical protein